MLATGNKHNINSMTVLTLRIADEELSFSVPAPRAQYQVVYENYRVRKDISMAANLREAFDVSELLKSGYRQARVMIDAPVLLVPIDEYDKDAARKLYFYTYSCRETDEVLSCVLPNLESVAVFAINKDLFDVIQGHFEQAESLPLCQPVWSYLHRRSFAGARSKMFVYFHEHKVEVFSFRQNRFRFCNTFCTEHVSDMVYYILHAWQVCGFNNEKDELYLAGNLPDAAELDRQLREFLQRVYAIRPTAEFNRAAMTRLKDMPFDLLTLYLQGR